MSDIEARRGNAEQKVVVTDVRIPFVSMVILMVKWSIASIPALIILAILGAILAGFFGAAFGP